MNRFAVSRDFLAIWAGQLVSAVGSRLSRFALSIWVLRTTGSTTQFALIFLAAALPAILVSPFSGALVDRWDRRRTLILCDLLSAITMFVLAGLLVSGHLAIWHLYIGVGSSAVFDAFRAPAFSASIPLLAARDQLQRVNGAVQSGNAIAAIIGPLLAGALVSAISFHGVLIIDAATFVVGLVTLALARIPTPLRTTGEHGSNLLREAEAGWRYVRERIGLLGLLVVYGSNELVFAVASVLIAPLLLSFTGPAMVGVQYAVSGVGLLLGGLATTALGGPTKKIHGVLAFSALAGLLLAAHGLWPSFMLITVAGFLLFFTLPIISASESSLWQSKVPADFQGRCFAMQQLLSNAMTACGYCLSGPVSEYVFEPLLAKGGLLDKSVGSLIGVGPGRGLGLMFILLGMFMTSVAVIAYGVPDIRCIDELADACSTTPANPSGAATSLAEQMTESTFGPAQ
jgi:MFS family permease